MNRADADRFYLHRLGEAAHETQAACDVALRRSDRRRDRGAARNRARDGRKKRALADGHRRHQRPPSGREGPEGERGALPPARRARRGRLLCPRAGRPDLVRQSGLRANLGASRRLAVRPGHRLAGDDRSRGSGAALPTPGSACKRGPPSARRIGSNVPTGRRAGFTAAASWYRTTMDGCCAPSVSSATSPASGRWKTSSGTRRRWKRWGRSRAAWRTTSATSCKPCWDRSRSRRWSRSTARTVRTRWTGRSRPPREGPR